MENYPVSLRDLDLEELRRELATIPGYYEKFDLLSCHLPILKQALDLGLTQGDIVVVLAEALLHTQKAYLESLALYPRSIVIKKEDLP